MERWQRAQEAERGYWEESFADEPKFRKMCLDFYGVYKTFLDASNVDTSSMSIIDIGSGPYSVLSVLDGKKKYAIDPLMEYFWTKIPKTFYKHNNIIAVNGKGEGPYFPKEFFDMVCCINTLDHADNPEALMKESNRITKPGGYLLLSCNHYAKPIVMWRRFLERIGCGDVCHPNTYHLDDLEKMTEKNGFSLINYKIGDVKESKETIKEVGGEIKVSLIRRLRRAAKARGIFYVIKQMLVLPGHYIFNRLFKTYPDSIFLCRKL